MFPFSWKSVPSSFFGAVVFKAEIHSCEQLHFGRSQGDPSILSPSVFCQDITDLTGCPSKHSTLVQIEMVSFRNYFWGFSTIKRHHMGKNAIFKCIIGFFWALSNYHAK